MIGIFYQIDLILELFFKRIKANFGIFLKHFTDITQFTDFKTNQTFHSNILMIFHLFQNIYMILHFHINSKHDWTPFFFKILLVLEQFHKCFNGHFPIVFKHIKIFINDQEITQKYFNKILFIQ
jgi:hypothetical protein